MKLTSKSDSFAGGYTLIEVLVAFTLLAMMLTVLLRGFGAGARNIRVASEFTQAVLLAEAQLAAVSNPSAPPADGALERRSEGFVVNLDVAPVEFGVSAHPAIEARRIGVAVIWPGSNNPRRVELSTIRLDPVDTDSGALGR